MSKKIFSVILAIALLFILKNYSKAANAAIQCNSEVNANTPLTISVSGSAVQWNLHLKVNGQTIASSSEVENVDGNKTISFSGTYTPTSEGSLTVTLEGSATEASNGSTITSFASKTVSVKKAESNNNSGSNTNSNSNSNSGSSTNANSNTAQTKSNIATLANLGINGQYDFTGFRATKTEYSVTVPNEVESVEIYAKKGQSGQKITGTGVKQLKEGTNAVNVVVTAEDGTTKKTYTINIERKSSQGTTEKVEENTAENTTEETTENIVENTAENTIENTEETSNERNVTEVTVNNLQSSKKKIIICAGIALIVLIIIVVVIIQKRKSKNIDEEYYYSELYKDETDDKIQINDENEENSQEQIEENYEEQPKHKKHQKGKRFK